MKTKKCIILIIILVIILIVLSSILIIFKSNTKPKEYKKLEKMNYSTEAINKIFENKIVDKVLEKDYSKTLDEAITTNEFEITNLDLYLSIKYMNKEDYINKLNKLISIGYNIEEIELIIGKIDYDDIEIINNYTYINDLKEYLEYDNFKISHLERYIDYRNNNKALNFNDIIKNVNMDLDKEPYVEPKTIENPNDMLILVNKHNKLPDDFEPENLEKINSKCTTKELLLNPEARKSFELMCNDVKSLGMNLRAISTYRTKDYQNNLYTNYSNRNGKTAADTFSARPRFSEHETGLAIDIVGGNTPYTEFHTTTEFNWVLKNAYNYGFIIRYPKDKEHITGYKYESWHIRYVGKDIAKYIYENNITFEEYYEQFLLK